MMKTGIAIVKGAWFMVGLVVPVLICLGMMGVLIYPAVKAAGYFG